MRPNGSAEELLHRRQRAIALLKQGLTKAEVARWIGACRRSVDRWYHRWCRGGVKRLQSRPVPGRPSGLTRKQRRQLVGCIRKGALASGFDSDQWTGRRVAAVIEKRFGVRYHRRSVPRLLYSLGLTLQRPVRIAREQDIRLKKRWLEKVWPAAEKNRPQETRLARFS